MGNIIGILFVLWIKIMWITQKITSITSILRAMEEEVKQKWDVIGRRWLGVASVLDVQSLFFYHRKMNLHHDQTSFWAKQYIIDKKFSFWLWRHKININIYFLNYIYYINWWIQKYILYTCGENKFQQLRTQQKLVNQINLQCCIFIFVFKLVNSDFK